MAAARAEDLPDSGSATVQLLAAQLEVCGGPGVPVTCGLMYGGCAVVLRVAERGLCGKGGVRVLNVQRQARGMCGIWYVGNIFF